MCSDVESQKFGLCDHFQPEPESFATVLMLYLLSSCEGGGGEMREGKLYATYPGVVKPQRV